MINRILNKRTKTTSERNKNQINNTKRKIEESTKSTNKLKYKVLYEQYNIYKGKVKCTEDREIKGEKEREKERESARANTGTQQLCSNNLFTQM